MQGCKLCRAGVDGQEWTDAVILGKKTPSQAAHHFKTNVDNILEHIYEHTILGIVDDSAGLDGQEGEATVQQGTGLVSMDFYSTEIMQILAYLKRYARGLSIHQSSGSKDIELSLKVMRELRLTVESLAEFQGRVTTKTHTTINIDSINMKYLSMTNVIRTELCPACRQKMLTAITDVDALQ